MKLSLKTILIIILLAVIAFFGLRVYYTWKQNQDMTVGEVIVDIFDESDDKFIAAQLGDSILSELQNTDESFATDKKKSGEFIRKYNVTLTAEEYSLYTAYSTQKLKSERIYQDIMAAASSKSWILYGDGNLYYIWEPIFGVNDMGPLSTIAVSRYIMDNSEDETIKKAYRFHKYSNGWEAFWATGKIFGSEYFKVL